MSTKDLFKKGNKVLTKSQVGKIKKDLESEELVRDVVKANNRFLSHVDYSEPKNFSFYGSAEKYYEDSFARIYKTYPYDGSQKEKQQWINDSSELDLWIYDKAYPKTTGYLKLDSEQSVFVKGGPNKEPGTTTGQKEELSKQYPTKQGKSNIWDPSLYRNSNLYLDASLGCTVEFWMKLDTPTLTFYPFVIGNTQTGNPLNGTRIQLAYSGTNSLLGFQYTDDTGTGIKGAPGRVVLNNFFEDTWNHYSFTFKNSTTNSEIEIYKNGILLHTIVGGAGTNLGTIAQEELYLNINGTMSGINGTRSNTISGMYIDDFRFWKTRRTGEEIGRYWNTSVFGGTNTDDDKYNSSNRKVDLGIYYKFNEGITGESSVDEVVLDYSGRISNGSIINYTSSVRSTGSAFDEYLDSNSEPLKNKEEREPIIYPMHPELLTELEKYRSKGLVYDLSNNSSIYHTMPSWITDEDGLRGENVKELSQVISSYFDNAQIQIQELTNLREKKYYSLDTETEKPFFLIRNTLKSQGLDVPDLFTEASVFEEILSRNETSKFEEKIQDVKNTIYQNIYNNLSFIYKSKGTEKSFRNLIRCFGIDDELVKVNLYSDGADYTLEDTRRNTAIKKRYVDFNNVDRENAIVYTKAEPSNTDSLSYIGGAGYAWDSHFPNLSFTFETEVIFPKKIPPSHPKYSPPVNSEENIAFLGKYRSGYSGQKIFSLKAIKEGNYASSENVKFSLSFDGQTVETGIFKSVYDNSKWNIAVRMVPKKEISTVASGADTTDYEVQLYCIKTTADIVEEEELISATITESVARDILATDKYLSIGSRRLGDNPEAASTNEESKLKISSTLFWYDNVENEEIKAHATDGSNFGRLYPNQDAYSTDSNFNTNTPSAIQVAKRDTLALHWDFSKVSTSDANGEFVVDDLSEGAEKILENINENSIHLDGVDDCVEVGDYDVFSFVDNDPALDKPFTVSAWAFRSGAQGVFVAKNSGNGQASDWFFGHSDGEIQVRIYDGTGSNAQVIGQNSTFEILPINEWHLVTFTYDGSQTREGVKIYLDGALQQSNNYPSNPATYNGRINTNSPLRIGANNANQAISNEFESNIADCYIFGSELSLAQVQELYNNGYVKNLKKHSAYLDAIAWWKMGDDQDSTNALGIKDYVGNHHGTLINDASIVSENTLGSDKCLKSGKYGWFTDLVGHQVTGLGKHFPINDNQVTNLEFIQSAKHRTPEVINSEELVRINSTDDIYYPKDATVTNHFFAVEKSMYQIISDDMINLFATIAEFNDLIGQPVNRYRIEYKALEKFRQRYYEKVKNVPSFEKYVELYKWIDSSIGMMIQQLIPMSSNFSADLKNMVESHVLERNKYWTKFPTMEMSGEPPLGILKGVNELTYNWKDGHAPVGAETVEDDKFLWGDQRIEADNALITTGDADVDANREILRKVSTRTTQGRTHLVDRDANNIFEEENKPLLRKTNGGFHEGRVYVNRALSKPYRFDVQKALTLRGGVNYSETTKDPNSFIRASTRIVPGAETAGVQLNGLVPNPVTYEEWKELYTVKRTSTVIVKDTEIDLNLGMDGDVIYPYYGDSYIDSLATLTNIHNDSYGDDAEIPVQGPFTETWVGGNQHRHIDPLRQEDRSELYLDDNGTLKHPHELSASNPAARYTRDEVAKRPLNVRNIKTQTTVVSKEDFQSYENGDVPAGWTTNESDETPANGPVVRSNNAATNKVLSLSTRLDLHSDITDPPGPQLSDSYYRWVQHANTFSSPMKVSFAVYEGRANGEYLCDEVPSLTDEEYLWLQYRVGDNGTWQNMGEPVKPILGSNLHWDLDVLHRRELTDVNSKVYLRWICFAKAPSATGNNDTWAIDNITIESSIDGAVNLLGNYNKDYEVVQTSGRSKNNRYFVRSEGEVSDTYTASPFVSGTLDFTLPDRGRTEHVIVERFSAPGDPLSMSRGHLDRIAEEFSVYSSMNYRNLSERLEHQENLYSHSAFYQGSQGYIESSNGLANIHKVNRNTNHTAIGKVHDNAYVSYQIPRSDFQYNVEMLSPDRKTYEFTLATDTDDFTLTNAAVKSSSTNSALFLSGSFAASIDDAPAGANHRFVEYSNSIHSRVKVGFKLNEGNVGSYAGVNALSANEDLYFQYKLGTGTWTTLKVFFQGEGYEFTGVSNEFTIDFGQSVDNPLYIRWVGSAAATTTGNWGIDDINIVPTSLINNVSSAEIVKGSEGYNASYADYQGAGYRFLRNLENPIVANQRRANTYSQIDRTDNSIRINQASSYIEPAVSWNKPNTHFILDETHDQKIRNAEVGSLIGVDLDKGSRPLTYSYTNNLEFFANPDLTNAIDVRKEREGQFYDSLTSLLSSGDLLFTRSIAREIIYPRHRNVGLKKTRSRGKYDTYKFFWKDKFQERIKTDNTTKLGYKVARGFEDLFAQRYSVDVLDNFYYEQKVRSAFFNTTASSDVEIADADILSPSTSGFSISMWVAMQNATGHLVSKQGEYEVSLLPASSQPTLPERIRVKIYDAPGTNSMDVIFVKPVTDSFSFSCLVVTYNGTGLDQDAVKVYYDGVELPTGSQNSIASLPVNTSSALHLGNLNGSSDYFEGNILDFAIYNEELSNSQVRDIFFNQSLEKTTSVSPVLRLPLANDALDIVGPNHGTPTGIGFVSEDNVYKVVGDLSYIGEDRIRHLITRKDTEPLNAAPTSSFHGITGLRNIESELEYSPLFANDYPVMPIPSPQLYHNPYNESYRESEGWVGRKSILTPNRASYNDYESFSEEIKLAAQNYGIVSEFRISEHMDKYILDNGGNFLAKNYDFLTLNGASYDGTTHTLTSGDSKLETSSFYSTAKEDDSQKVTSYPVNNSDPTLVSNHADGLLDNNRIYSPSNSTFVISNSVNSSFEISATSRANYISVEPNQSGTNASALFNIYNTNDFLISDCDVVAQATSANIESGLTLTQNDSETMPFTVSIWAQPVTSAHTSNGLWCAGNDIAPGLSNLNLFSKYQYSDGASGYDNFGLTFSISADGGNDPIPGGKPGGTIDDTSTVYVFFKSDGTIAHLTEGRMNHVVFQMVPPEKTKAVNGALNFAIKLWLDGEELFGVHIREFADTRYVLYGNAIASYSPCPIGDWQSGGSHPWSVDYFSGFSENLPVSPIKAFVIGNCDYEDSYHNNNAYGGPTPQFPFVGLLDEFCLIRGILPSESIKNLYNSGVPVNVNELIINEEIKGNLLVGAADNGEWDFAGYDTTVVPILNDDLQSYTPPAINNVVPAGTPFKYLAAVDASGFTTARLAERQAQLQDQGDAVDNQLIVLKGDYVDPNTVDPPTPVSGTLHWRWIQLGRTGSYTDNPRLISFKVRQGTGSGTPGANPTNDDYRMEAPNANEDLWFQYSEDEGTSWKTLRHFPQDTQNPWTLDTTHSIHIPESESTRMIFRWICGTYQQNDNYDHWGIDDIKLYASDALVGSFDDKIKYVNYGNTQLTEELDFDVENWTADRQAGIRPLLTAWHRLGVPNYDKDISSGGWDDNFFDSYVHADNINFIEKSATKHDTLGLVTSERVRLKINAIKKLLPYEGFYPQDRTVQLADLFVQKIKQDISFDENSHEGQALQAALQHFFAPGILYNSIKSGIACDWASYTNASGLEPSYYGSPILTFDPVSGAATTKYSERIAPSWYTGLSNSSAYSAEDLLDTPPEGVRQLDLSQGQQTATDDEILDFRYIITQENLTINNYDPNVWNFKITQQMTNLFITKEPNKRLPFEAILDPYKYLLDGNDSTMLDNGDPNAAPNHKSHHNQHFLMKPSYYKDMLEWHQRAYQITDANGTTNMAEYKETETGFSKYRKYNYPYFEISRGILNKDKRYELAINNFLAESTKFFIKDERLSSFASTKPQGSGYMMASGSAYFMDVVLEKSVDFQPVNSPGTLGGRYFGPPTHWLLNPSTGLYYKEKEKISDAAFAPYVPPYFYAASRVRIKFTADETKKFTLDEIFEGADVEDISPEVDDFFANEAFKRVRTSTLTGAVLDDHEGGYKASVAYKSRMPISSSIELFGKTKLSRQEFDTDGTPRAVTTANNEELDTWVIYSKFECPLFNFSDSRNSSTLSSFKRFFGGKKETVNVDNATYEFNFLNPFPDSYFEDKRTGSGIWAGFGQQQDGTGVTISIRESFPEGVSASTGSLIDVCGFTPETKQIGRVADEKQISEAVVMIPFLDEPLVTEQQLYGGGTRNVYATINVDDRNFIKIPKMKYRRQKRNLSRGIPAYTLNGREVESSSITQMIEGMRKYNVPPLYDFETFDKEPFIMYFFEFSHTLDREDLSNIWQGVQPKIAKEASLDSVEVTHDINEEELFGNLGEIPKGVRWMIFKVKQKAEKSYYNLTEDSRDDRRFKFNFDVGTKEPEYGYNYPYDYFTMLEMIQVEANSEKRVSPLEQLNRSLEDDE